MLPFDILTGQTQGIIVSPRWFLRNTINMPTGKSTQPEIGVSYQHAVNFIFATNIALQNLFDDNANLNARSLGEDQLNIFHSIEGSLSGMGVDGRSCLLRLICELQANSVGRFTVIGEILAVLFTPKRGMNDFLHEYIEAEVTGTEGKNCQEAYSTCPFSLINAMKQYNLYAQGQSSYDQKPLDNGLDHVLSNDIHQMPQMSFS